jgi:hypothetical protein
MAKKGGGNPAARAKKLAKKGAPDSLQAMLQGTKAGLEAIPDEVRIHWQFSTIDWACSWSFEHHENGQQLRETLESLAALEGVTMGELRKRFAPEEAGRYLQPVRRHKLCPEAVEKWDRLQEGRGALLYHFRTKSHPKSRVWAAYIEPTMHLLWWDPDHKVMP